MEPYEALHKTKCMIKLANCDMKLIHAIKALKCMLTVSLIVKSVASLVLIINAAANMKKD
ncbi:MAG: hypothetical protein PUB20_02645 [Clostridia bacterium]|nr:hypothetical protein [Clostridia bacterium]